METPKKGINTLIYINLRVETRTSINVKCKEGIAKATYKRNLDNLDYMTLISEEEPKGVITGKSKVRNSQTRKEEAFKFN